MIDETKRIVEWLRAEIEGMGTDPCRYVVADLADRIEAGDHLKDKTE